MPAEHRALSSEDPAGTDLRFHVSEAYQMITPDSGSGKHSGHVIVLSFCLQRFLEIQESAAFRNDGQSLSDLFPERPFHILICCQFLSPEFRISSRQQHAVGILRNARIMQRGKRNKFCSHSLQQFFVFLVKEGKCLIPGDGQTDGDFFLRHGDLRFFHGVPFRCVRGNIQKRIHIRILFQKICHHSNFCGYLRILLGLIQPKMTGGNGQFRTVRNRSQYRNRAVPPDLLQFSPPVRIRAVEQHAGNMMIFPEIQDPTNLLHYRLVLLLTVHHQDHRSIGKGRDFIGAGPSVGPPDAVIISHDAFQHRNIAPTGMVLKQTAQHVRRREKTVEIPRRHLLYTSMKHGIDIIRSALKRDRMFATAAQRLQQRAGQ